MEVLLRDLETKQTLISRLQDNLERNAGVLSGLTGKAMQTMELNEQIKVD